MALPSLMTTRLALSISPRWNMMLLNFGALAVKLASLKYCLRAIVGTILKNPMKLHIIRVDIFNVDFETFSPYKSVLVN
ncbi:CTP synthase 1-B [Trichinella spiralis]|uniref:CTP synthase 1-B n=1 Tax=Trichinella spiralis TaxID=6334 RepID=A0ABR3KL08_TRISP